LTQALRGDETIEQDARTLEAVLAVDAEEIARNQRARARE